MLIFFKLPTVKEFLKRVPRQSLSLQVVLGGEVSAPDDFTREDREPQFDLVQPGAVFQRVVEHDAMTGVTEKGGPGRHRLEDSTLAFATQLAGIADFSCDEAYHGLGAMGVEVVHHQVPGCRR